MNPSGIISGLLLHLHPKSINRQTLKYTRTFGLGGISLLLFLVLAFTGLLLRFAYVPTSINAYDSILQLQNNSLLGSLLRNVHHWTSILMVIAVFLHLLRVFYSQSIYYERKRNWIYGLIMFAFVLSFNFTGYLLPWDQLSYWAVTIMTNILEYLPLVGNNLANIVRGGEYVNENTLSIFYNLHTGLLPVFFIALMAIHFWLVRKAKGVTFSDKGEVEKVPVYPNLVHREIIVAIVLLVFVLTISIFFDAPLLDRANPMVSPNPSKAPWYFVGFQELLIHLHPLLSAFIIPFLLVGFLIGISFMKIDKELVGSWFYSQKGRRAVVVASIFALLLTCTLILLLEYVLNPIELTHWPLFVSTGLLPLFLYVIPVIFFLLIIYKMMHLNRAEIMMSIFTLLVVSYLVMSVVGYYFRGESMHLVF
jgi:quinol-cytochrome oxidoreductase complex cytochrome b subunit